MWWSKRLIEGTGGFRGRAVMLVLLGLVAVSFATACGAGQGGEYLPPTEQSVTQLVKDWSNEGTPGGFDFSGGAFYVSQGTDMQALPSGSDDDPDHWFHVEWDSPYGDTYSWDANPWSEEVYQEGVSIDLGG
jgi:hypothetical protein